MGDRRRSSTRKCTVGSCEAMAYKNNYCVDHYREFHGQTTHIAPEVVHQQESMRAMQADSLDKIAEDFPYFTDRKLQQMKTKFMEYDEDNSGDLNLFEVGLMMEKLGQPKTRAELRDMITEVDMDGSGTISFREYLMVMTPPEFRQEEQKEAPISLFGRIAQSALSEKAKFFETMAAANKPKSDEEVRAQIRAEAGKRKLERARAVERREAEIAAAKKAEDDAARRKAFAERAAKFGGGGN